MKEQHPFFLVNFLLTHAFVLILYYLNVRFRTYYLNFICSSVVLVHHDIVTVKETRVQANILLSRASILKLHPLFHLSHVV